MKRFMAWAAIMTLLSLCMTGQVVRADCDGVLKPTYVELRNDRSLALSYARIMDVHTYEEMKQDASASADIPILGALIGASASYSEFHSRAYAYHDDETLSLNERESSSYVKTGLTDEEVSAWLKCKLEGAGVALVPRNPVPGGFALRIEYRPPHGHTEAIVATVTFIGGTSDGRQRVAVRLDGNYDETIPVKGRAGGVVQVIVNARGYTDDIAVRLIGGGKTPHPERGHLTKDCTATEHVFAHGVMKQSLSLVLPPETNASHSGMIHNWAVSGTLRIARTAKPTTSGDWFVEISGYGGVTHSKGNFQLWVPVNVPSQPDNGHGSISLILDVGAVTGDEQISVTGADLEFTPLPEEVRSIPARPAKMTARRKLTTAHH